MTITINIDSHTLATFAALVAIGVGLYLLRHAARKLTPIARAWNAKQRDLSIAARVQAAAVAKREREHAEWLEAHAPTLILQRPTRAQLWVARFF